MSEPDGGSQNGSSDSSNDSLNGSWVKLDESYKNGNERPFSIHNGEMESLLAEAAEDRAAGTQSHRPSLPPPTPTDERATESKADTVTKVLPQENLTSDQTWIENWASRIEPHPPKKWRLTYPPQKHNEKEQKMSKVKSKTDEFQVNFYIVIPTLLFTHIIAFGIGFYVGRRSSSGTVAV